MKGQPNTGCYAPGVVSDERTLSGGRTQPEGHGRRPLAIGDQVSRYVVSERIGAGGMGVVYRAHDPELDRDVALKLLDTHWDDRGSKSNDRRARMTREAQAMARLSHPNVITVHDVGEHAGSIFIAMELVEGMTLATWLARHEPPVDAVVDAFVLAGRGLVAAHDAALVHRDFKPDNVMVELRPETSEIVRLVVMDFGLARGTGEPSPPVGVSGSKSSLDTDITGTGPMGTPAYMSPEQHMRENVGPASDQFSFCVSLYEAIYKQRPFEGDAVALALAAIEGNVRPIPKRDDVPAWLERAVVRGISALPDERWPSMAALLRELSRDRGRSKRVALLAGAVLVTGVAAWSQGRGPEPCAGVGEEIESVWSRDARDRIAGAFAASDVPGAEQTWTRLQTELDAYASSWQVARQRACRDAGDEHDRVSQRRRQCLDSSLVHFEATIEVLSNPDAEAIHRSATVGRELPPIAWCSSESYLLADVEPPPEAIAERVDELRGEHKRIQARIVLGQLEDAQRAAEAAVMEARALGYVPLQAELTSAFGNAKSQLGKQGDAVALWEEAYHAARGAGYYTLAAKMAVSLGHAYAVGKRELDTAKEWVEHGRALIDRGDDARKVEYGLLTVEASIAWAEERYDDAIEVVQRALAIAETIHGPDSPEVAEQLLNLGLYETNAGRAGDALPRFSKGIEILESEYGLFHPKVAEALLNRGVAQARAGLGEASLASYQRALAIREKATPGHASIASLVQNIAIRHAEQGATDKALPMFARALELRTKALDERHPLVGSAHLNLGEALSLAARYDEALEHLYTGLDIVSAALGPESPDAGLAHAQLGDVRMHQGDHERALTHHQTAYDIFAKALGEDHPQMVTAGSLLAQARAKNGHVDEALAGYARALALAERVQSRPMDVAKVQFEYAKLRVEHGKLGTTEARAIVRTALELLPEGTPARDEATAWLLRWESRGG